MDSDQGQVAEVLCSEREGIVFGWTQNMNDAAESRGHSCKKEQIGEEFSHKARALR